jgi:predicted peptidase
MRHSAPAILFTSLVLLLAGSARAANAADKIGAEFQKKMYTDKAGNQMPYRLYIPPSYDAKQKYPLILWLHGAADRGFDNDAQISGGNVNGTRIWTTPQNQAQFPAFVLAPQCPEHKYWAEPDFNIVSPELQVALDILAVVEKDWSIDADRVYLAGQSMGGLGAWALLQAFPKRWAGALVLCAYDNFTSAQAIARVPVWVFQGDADLTVPVTMVRDMIKQLEKAGGKPRYSEYHNVGHEVWVKAFAEPELVPWLAAQKRPGTNEAGRIH